MTTLSPDSKIDEIAERAVQALDKICDLPVSEQVRAAFGMLFTHPFDGGFPFFLLIMRIALNTLWFRHILQIGW